MQSPRDQYGVSGFFCLNIMEDNFVKIEFNSMYWNVQAIETEEEKTGKKLVRLEWGWGAGLTEEERREAEEDNVPAGFKSVTMTIEGVAMLANRLIEILQKNPDESEMGKFIVDYIEGKQKFKL